MDMSMPARDWMPSLHAGSGTAWEPASVPGAYVDDLPRRVGSDGARRSFCDLQPAGWPTGRGQSGVGQQADVDGAAQVGRATLLLRQMFSAESLTSPHPGLPANFSDGRNVSWGSRWWITSTRTMYLRSCRRTTRCRSLRSVSWQLYGGPSAEPALGPVTYIHRAPRSELPAAPLSHHLQDSTHTSFGVVTTGVVVSRFKVEGSVFNGREPNEERWSIQLGALDSWSARALAWFLRATGRRNTAMGD